MRRVRPPEGIRLRESGWTCGIRGIRAGSSASGCATKRCQMALILFPPLGKQLLINQQQVKEKLKKNQRAMQRIRLAIQRVF